MAKLKTMGWADESIGQKKNASKKNSKDVDLDLDEFDLGLEEDGDPRGEEFATEKESKPKKKVKKKTKKKASKPVKEEPIDEDENGDYGDLLGDSWDDEGAEEGLAPTKAPKSDTETAAGALGLNLAMECPVCRSLKSCDCEEEDRAFVRRTRFEAEVKKVARCARCQAPLSVLHLPRPGSAPPYRLAQFVAVYSCVPCSAESLATVALSARRF